MKNIKVINFVRIVILILFIQVLAFATKPETCLSKFSALAQASALFRDYNRLQGYEFLGANPAAKGTHFAFFLPNAKEVELISEANGWAQGTYKLVKDNNTGAWAGIFPDIKSGMKYKLKIKDANGNIQYRNDPYAKHMVQSGTEWNSVVWDSKAFKWTDSNFKMPERLVIEEVNVRTRTQNQNANYRELADKLIPELKKQKVNTVSLMPVHQHNVVESWGYQPGGVFAVNPRHGTPDDLKYFVNKCHENGIAVIFDVVLGHASHDWNTGLGMIDGTELYFWDNYLKEHKDWGTMIYDFRKPHTQEFLISAANYYIKELHGDGLRVDGVTSMLYLDYSRSEAEKAAIWRDFGTNINEGAISFIRRLNEEVHKIKPNAITIAEESSGFAGVTHKLSEGPRTLGFDYMWGMGGMHDVRAALKAPPEHRNMFQMLAPIKWNENYINYLNSHDEISNGKGRFMGDVSGVKPNQEFDASRNANALLALVFPGRPMTFQGDDYADKHWWDIYSSVDESLKTRQTHTEHAFFMKDMREFYQKEPAFKRDDKRSSKNLMIDNQGKVMVQARLGSSDKETLIVVQNWGDKLFHDYKIPLPNGKKWKIVFNSDAKFYGGDGTIVETSGTLPQGIFDNPNSLEIKNLPPYTTIVLKAE